MSAIVVNFFCCMVLVYLHGRGGEREERAGEEDSGVRREGEREATRTGECARVCVCVQARLCGDGLEFLGGLRTLLD